MLSKRLYEKLLKVGISMVENNTCGILALSAVLKSLAVDMPSDLEGLNAECKQAAELATRAMQDFSRPVVIEYVTREEFRNGDYTTVGNFEYGWASNHFA